MLQVRTITQPTTEPISLAEAKQWLEVDGSEHDDYITHLIKAARAAAENYTNRAFFTQTIQELYSQKSTVFELRRNPVQSVTSITYTDEENQLQTLDTSKYIVDIDSIPARIILKKGETFPDFYPETHIKVTYLAGETSTSNIPAVIKQAMIYWMREAYDNPGNLVAMKTTAFERALAPYQMPWA